MIEEISSTVLPVQKVIPSQTALIEAAMQEYRLPDAYLSVDLPHRKEGEQKGEFICDFCGSGLRFRLDPVSGDVVGYCPECEETINLIKLSWESYVRE